MTFRRIASLVITAVIATSCGNTDKVPERAGVCPSIELELATCSAEDSHAGQRECLARLAARTDAELAVLEAAIKTRIPQWEPEDQAMDVYREEFDERLDAGIAAYRRYREAQCGMWASRAAGGNGAGDMRQSCRVELDCERVSDMTEMLLTFEDRN